MSYVYIQTEKDLWTVGFYRPDGAFITDSDHDDRYEARDRVAHLNGGAPIDILEALKEAAVFYMERGA